MKSQIMKKEEEVEKLKEEVVTLRSKIVKFNKNLEETETTTSVIENEEKHSKEGIMVNQNLRKLLKIHRQEYHQCSSQKEASIMIMIIQGKNSKGLHHKEDNSLSGMQIYFMVIVFTVLILDIRL
jgi:hypothetical protein